MNQRLKQQMQEIIDYIQDTKLKNAVKSFFRKDVENFNQKFCKLESKIKNKRISPDDACRSVFNYIDDILSKAQKIEAIVDSRLVQRRIKKLFRESITESFIEKSFIIHRGYIKPSGHPGDFELIEMFYNNIPLSEGVGYFADKYILQDSYVEAVRIRKNITKRELFKFIKNSDSKALNIMNIGCGSCREIREILPNIANKKKAFFTLIDWDNNALEFAKKHLRANQYNSAIKFGFVKEDIINLYRGLGGGHKIIKRQDFIYSIGLADYLPDLVLGELIKFCFKLLKKDGIFMMAHKNVKVHKSPASDWFCNWSFYPRNEQDIKKMINENLKRYKFTTRLLREETQHIFFTTIKKL